MVVVSDTRGAVFCSSQQTETIQDGMMITNGTVHWAEQNAGWNDDYEWYSALGRVEYRME